MVSEVNSRRISRFSFTNHRARAPKSRQQHATRLPAAEKPPLMGRLFGLGKQEAAPPARTGVGEGEGVRGADSALRETP